MVSLVLVLVVALMSHGAGTLLTVAPLRVFDGLSWQHNYSSKPRGKHHGINVTTAAAAKTRHTKLLNALWFLVLMLLLLLSPTVAWNYLLLLMTCWGENGPASGAQCQFFSFPFAKRSLD